MFTYFDKAFFKFAAGFVALLCLSFVVFIITGYYQTKADRDKASQACCTPISAQDK